MTATTAPKVLPQCQETPYGFLIPKLFSLENYRSALEYKPRPDDLFIVSYPKCGTTWVQNIVTCVYREGNPPFDSALDFFFDSPLLELFGAEAAENMKRPGAIKTHLPLHILPWSEQAKYIFIVRNPKDCCVSCYHHMKNRPSYEFHEGAFDDVFELFMDGKVDYGDYYDIILSWYERRNYPNVLFISYEEIQRDIRNTILKIAEFMGNKYKEMLEQDEEVIKNVIKYSSFKFMRENLNRKIAEMAGMTLDDAGNYHEKLPFLQKLFNPDPYSTNYVRKGTNGDWKNHFSEEQNKRMEEKFKEKTKGTDIPELFKDVM